MKFFLVLLAVVGLTEAAFLGGHFFADEKVCNLCHHAIEKAAQMVTSVNPDLEKQIIDGANVSLIIKQFK